MITHYKQFNGAQQLVDDFYNTIIDGLGEKLGGVLIQLPKQLKYSSEALEKIISQLDHSVQNVLEFRGASWWNEEVYSRLSKEKLTFCGHSYPGLPEDVVVNNKTVYYRFHGKPKLYFSQYRKAVLENFADEIKHSKKAREVFVYFNNTARMAAIRNAKYLAGIV